jgi:hypothetical protein
VVPNQQTRCLRTEQLNNNTTPALNRQEHKL